MRRVLLLCALVSLAVPLASVAATRGPGDGTLSVKDLNGMIRITNGRGAIVGRCDSCTFVLTDGEIELDSNVEGKVVRERDKNGDGEMDTFTGRNLRWKVVNDRFMLWVKKGTDVDISVVGKANVRVRGTAGEYAVNGGDYQAIPNELAAFVVTAP